MKNKALTILSMTFAANCLSGCSSPHTHSAGFLTSEADPGYAWVDKDSIFNSDVVWTPGLVVPGLAHVIAAAGEGKFTLEDGYSWSKPDSPEVSAGVWIPGLLSDKHKHVLTSTEEGKFIPQDGYDWQDRSNINIDQVVWKPGMANAHYLHMQAYTEEGKWLPDVGYGFTDRNNLASITFIGNADPRYAAQNSGPDWGAAAGYGGVAIAANSWAQDQPDDGFFTWVGRQFCKRTRDEAIKSAATALSPHP